MKTLKLPDKFSVQFFNNPFSYSSEFWEIGGRGGGVEGLQEQRGGSQKEEVKESDQLSWGGDGESSLTAGSWRFLLPTQVVSGWMKREKEGAF